MVFGSDETGGAVVPDVRNEFGTWVSGRRGMTSFPARVLKDLADLDAEKRGWGYPGCFDKMLK